MKKLMLFMIALISLTMSHELYAKGKSGKDKPEREKVKHEKVEHEKNIKSVDAQKNWGKLKSEYEDLSKSEQKEMKAEISTKKRIRKEIRKEIEKNSDLDLSLIDIDVYDPNFPNDIEKLVESLFDYYSGNMIDEEPVEVLEPVEILEPLESLRLAGMNDVSINKIEKALLKYKEKFSVLEENIDDEDIIEEDLEEINLLEENSEDIQI